MRITQTIEFTVIFQPEKINRPPTAVILLIFYNVRFVTFPDVKKTPAIIKKTIIPYKNKQLIAENQLLL